MIHRVKFNNVRKHTVKTIKSRTSADPPLPLTPRKQCKTKASTDTLQKYTGSSREPLIEESTASDTCSSLDIGCIREVRCILSAEIPHTGIRCI
jgi:hypothetical protein